MTTPKKQLSILLTVIAGICLAAAGILIVKSIRDTRASEEVLEAMRASAEASMEASGEANTVEASLPAARKKSAGKRSGTRTEEMETQTAEEARVPNPYRDSFLANADMAAWLVIPDTDIDYPVMWTPEDETYYLYRDFEGNDNQNGCLLLDTESCVDPLTTNLIIHGHNMKSGAMFGNLTDYEKESFYREHRKILLYTEDCQRTYEVIAVFRSQVYKKTEEVFKFYKFFQADTPEEFDDFYQNIKELSIYDTGVTAEFGDHFITLSTCVYHVPQGRFVVVGKEVESGEQYLPLQE